MRALNLDPGHATSLFNLADLYRWETLKTGGKIGNKNREKQWVGNRQNRRKQSEQEIGEKQEKGNLKERQFMGNVFGKKKGCENDKQQIALDSGEEDGGSSCMN